MCGGGWTRIGTVVAGVCLLALPGVRGDDNLIVNGDFERTTPQAPPPGWTMWGAERYKVPADFTRDTDHPHAGKAAFRIHHPAGTGGYVVSAPDHAIRSRPGMMYTVSFWARADRPGRSEVGLMAYRSLQGFVDAPWPGSSPIEVSHEWKAYTFTFYEGCDFFAEESRYLLVLFKAAAAAPDERTLWVDDVVVTERPTTKLRLANPATLQYAPIEHRLAPGAELVVRVDAQRPLRPVLPEVAGVSIHRVAGWTGVPYNRKGQYVLRPELEDAVRQLRLPMTRLYAVGEEPFGLEGAIDRAAELYRKFGVPASSTVLEFEIQDAHSKLPPETWVRGVRHALARGYGFRYWEISNEPYVGDPGPLLFTPDTYAEHLVEVSRAIRAAHPEGQIGMSINGPETGGPPAWNNYLLKKAAGSYDFVVPHYYFYVRFDRTRFEDVVLTGNFEILDKIQKINALLHEYNPGRTVYQYDTEWGPMGRDREGQAPEACNRNSNIVGLLHRAVRLIYYVREAPMHGASAWEMFTFPDRPGYSFLSQAMPGRRAMNYWLFYYVNRHLGRTVLEMTGTAPYHEGTLDGRRYRGPLTPAVVTLAGDGRRLFAIVANGSWDRAVPCRIELTNFAAGRATAVVLSHSDPAAGPFLERKDDLVGEAPVRVAPERLALDLPPHSVVFVTVEAP
jgi:hypothetical protein